MSYISQPETQQQLSPVATAFTTASFRYNPLNPVCPVVFDSLRPYGVSPYEAEAEAEPAPLEGPTVTIVVGNVPHGTKASRLRWVVKHVTGVTPLAVRDGRRNGGKGRTPTGLYFIKVRSEDVDHMISKSECALCFADYVWVPEREDVKFYFASVAKELKLIRFVKTNPLTFELSKDKKTHEQSIIF